AADCDNQQNTGGDDQCPIAFPQLPELFAAYILVDFPENIGH
ncbi:MAG: hypothetical protein QOF91_372, partial [Alphaproteobacteria bacterium]|nr:hypothetical protein [Alphaproteobacteria bacterium]